MTESKQKAQITSKHGLRRLPAKREHARLDTNSNICTPERTLDQCGAPTNVPLGSSSADIVQKDDDDKGSTELVKFDDGNSPEQDALEFVRYSVEQFSDKLDPFAQLPVSLDRFQEHLVSFYLLYYPKVTYGLSARLKPHPVATNFSIAVNNPPNFQVALARSALYRISLQKYTTESEKRDLEIAVIRHKGEAIRMVKHMSAGADTARNKDNLIAAIISLGTLDNRTGADDTASMHFMAVRRLLRSIGGPLHITSALLSRVMVHFECIYGTVNASYVWDRNDLSRLLLDINRFLADVWDLWRMLAQRHNIMDSTAFSTSSTDERSISPLSSIATSLVNAFALQPTSSLHEALSRPLKRNNQETTPQDKMQLTFQLTCLLAYCHTILDQASDPKHLKKYIANTHSIIDDAQLTSQPCNNHMWLLQVHDQSSTHNKRIWRTASFVWLLKHLPYDVQGGMRDWLLAFCAGEGVAGRSAKKLDTFHFSYAMATPTR